MAITNTDTKLRFLYGKYANLPTTKTEGTVYITTDEGSQNMFVDIGGSRIRLHKFMIVDSIPGSVPDPVEGVVYYGKTGNILAYHNGSSWVQINSQRLFQSYLATFNSSATNVGTAGDGVRVQSVISPDGSNESDIANRGTAWQLESGRAETTKVQVGGTTTTSISGDSAGGSNREITVPIIKVTSANTDTTTTFKVTDGAGATSSTSSSSSFKLVGTNKTTGYDALGAEVKTTADDVTAMTVNLSGGNVTVTSGNVANVNTRLTSITPVFDDDGNFKVNVEHPDGNNAVTVNSTQPKITVGVDANKRVTSYFKKGEALLNGVYSAAEVDSAITELEELINANVRAAQAMQYKGVLSTRSYELPTTGVSIGDTYIVDKSSGQTSVSFDGPNGAQTELVEVGDMFIAYGTEGTDGFITSETLLWHYIPAGNDSIAEYRVALSASEFSLSSYMNDDLLNHLGSIKVGAQLKGVVDSTAKTLTISHDDIEVAETPATGTPANLLGNNDTFTVVTGVTIGTNGHVTGYTTTTYTVQAGLSNASSKSTAAAYTSGTFSGATVTPHIETYGGTYAETPFTVTTTTASALVVSGSGSNVNIELVWGTFD